ncbi:MAG: Gfo/Idh/MocA family oxidoreductase [Sphaerochaeta sp.]|nr:Gfo/Idh/MocA family oxidoreductase [Sphaerochaeta sp.]
MQKMDGQNYAPEGKPQPVCSRGEFIVGVVGLDHGHIYGMCNGLSEAGADIAYVFDPDPKKIEAFVAKFPQAQVASSKQQVLENPAIQLIASAGIPCDRGPLGLEVLDHGKDYFSDKPPFTTQTQVDLAREKVMQTKRKWFVYYSERLHVEAAVYAERLLNEGAIGNIVSIRGWGPHRLAAANRPSWFFEKEKYGGILVDIGSHQLEQILQFSGAEDATLISSRVGNLYHPEYPGLEDFGDACFTASNGIPCYFSLDWYTPDGLGTWGDGRIFIVGTKGYIELRKYIDVAASKEGDNVILVNDTGEHHYRVGGKVGFPYFGRLIRDVLDRTETAMKQEHAFRAIELAIEAETKAEKIR